MGNYKMEIDAEKCRKTWGYLIDVYRKDRDTLKN